MPAKHVSKSHGTQVQNETVKALSVLSVCRFLVGSFPFPHTPAAAPWLLAASSVSFGAKSGPPTPASGFAVPSGLRSLLLRMVLKLLMRCCTSKQHGDDQEKIDFGGGNVHVVTRKDYWDRKVAEANRDGKIVVANFSAGWCGPCRVISPVYAEMSQTYPQLMFLTIDVDELMDFSSSWDIRATPTFFFLKNGQQVDKLVGANKPELEKKVAAHAGAGGGPDASAAASQSHSVPTSSSLVR